jgi:hypothetical protein
MAHRKGEKEALRRQREEREAKARAEQQRKRLVGYGGAAALVVAAVVVVLLLAGGGGNGGGAKGEGNFFPDGGDAPTQKVFDLEEAARGAGCTLSSSKGSGVATHTASLDEKVNYKDNPPTTGRHYQVPADDGVYNGQPPPDEALVHALEHGRVIIWVKPSVAEDARATIRAMDDEDEGFQTLLVQRKSMPYAVAATAWNRDPQPGGTGRTLGCDRWTPEVLDALRAFRDEHRSNGPEPVP